LKVNLWQQSALTHQMNSMWNENLKNSEIACPWAVYLITN
jgi:hypothetical protein